APLTGDPVAQQAYVKASNTDSGDTFGIVAISGNTVVVGAFGEASAANGVNGDQSDNSSPSTGAAYVFVRNGNTWSQQAYLKASNAGKEDWFGSRLAMSGDGNTIAVGSQLEDSAAKGIKGKQNDKSAQTAGDVYIYKRKGKTWT